MWVWRSKEKQVRAALLEEVVVVHVHKSKSGKRGAEITKNCRLPAILVHSKFIYLGPKRIKIKQDDAYHL